ncbi:YdcF family protein [Marinobacterium jannaschii]|uniref:YdcF family protein n=1 Tax=Marinobacterium jannaschii TaxID=64970 RepID=UPI0004820D93|nr:YdcF family protein [Marinobacterium jannaschii]
MADLFFIASKLFWALIAPEHFLILLLLIGLLWRGSVIGRWLLGFSLCCQLLIAALPVGNYLLRPLEQRFPQPELPTEIGGIIVLGGGENPELSQNWGQPQFNAAAERVMVLPQLMQKYPQAQVIFSGGSGRVLRQDVKGADGVGQWLRGLQLGERLTLERQSRNTHENAVLSKPLAEDLDKPWLLITSAFHMPRSVGIFRQQAWPVIPYPVDYYSTEGGYRPIYWRNARDLNIAVREWIGLTVYYFTGKTNQLLPAVENTTDV